MNAIKKTRQGKGYNKTITKEQKKQIKLQLEQKIKTPAELAKEYGLSRSTINSYLKTKRPIYSSFQDAILKRVYEWVEKMFNTLNQFNSTIKVKKTITTYLKREGFFQNSLINPIFDLIPQTKMKSNKQRIFRKVLSKVFQYFQNKKAQNDVVHESYFASDTPVGSDIFEDVIDNYYQYNPSQNIQITYQYNSYVKLDEDFKTFDEDDIYSFTF